jgi:endonuclease YncB( thermonuclease family)
VFPGLLIFLAGLVPVLAGDSLYGKVVEVKSADVVTLDYGAGQYELRLVGIDVPRDGPIATKATEFVSNLVLGKNARMRFEGRTEGGEMMVRLFTDDPEIGIKEVGVELVRAGLARRQNDFDFKYAELSAAEKEAKDARRGLWAAAQPQ